MRYRLRTLLIIVTGIAFSLALFRSEEIYFRFKYGSRVPAGEIRRSAINGQSLGLIIRGERFRTGDSMAVREYVWAAIDGAGRLPDVGIHGVWETPFEDRPYVVKVGRETLFVHRVE